MKVTRAQVFQALEATRNRYLFGNQAEEAAELDDQIAYLGRVPGQDLNSMVETAEGTSARLNDALLVKDLRAGFPCGPVTLLGGVAGGLALGAGAATLAQLLKLSEGWTALAAVTAGLGGALLPMAVGMIQTQKLERMAGAAETLKKHRPEIIQHHERSQGPALKVERFLTLARSAETDYLRQGKPSSAARISRVAGFVSDTGRESLVEAFNHIHSQALTDREWRERLTWMEQTPELPALLHSMSEVERLGGDAEAGLEIEFEENSVTIGSVVLPHQG